MITQIKNYRLHRLNKIFLVFIFISAASCFGQSFFSMKGFGEEILYTDANSAALAGLVGLSRENPAFPIALTKTNFSGTVLSNFVYGQENSKSRMIYDIRPLVIDGKIPLPYNFRIGMNLRERFNQNFDIYSDSIPFSGYWTRRQIIGKGGIYGLSFNAGKSFPKQKISLGFEYSRLLGQAVERWYFDIINGNYRTEDSITTNYSAHNLRFGICSEISFITLGIFGEDILPGKISSKVVSHGAVVDSVDGLKFNLPYSLGIGLAVNKFERTKLYFDVFYRAWDKTTIADTAVSRFSNSMKYSIAAEHWLTDYYPLRVGLRYYSLYLTDHLGLQIKEYALTCGSSMPIPKFGYFDYSLEIIQRQGKEIKETIGRINFSLSFEEAWKKRTRRWGY